MVGLGWEEVFQGGTGSKGGWSQAGWDGCRVLGRNSSFSDLELKRERQGEPRSPGQGRAARTLLFPNTLWLGVGGHLCRQKGLRLTFQSP